MEIIRSLDHSLAARCRGQRRARLIAGLVACYALAGVAWWNTLGCQISETLGLVLVTVYPVSGGNVSIACARFDADSNYLGDECPGEFDPNLTTGELPYRACLSASPAADFSYWSGTCLCDSGASIFPGGCGGPNQCELTVPFNTTIACEAHFSCADVAELGVEVIGAGAVSSDPAGIQCSSGICRSQFCGDDAGPASVSLSASGRPGSGQVFVGWEGDPDCEDGFVTMDGDKSCVARFRQPILTVSSQGAGRVTAPGVECREGSAPSECQASLPFDLQVNVVAHPDPGASFVAFDGDCFGAQSSAVVQMRGDAICNVTFTTVGAGTGAVAIVSRADDESLGNFPVAAELTAPDLSGSADFSRVSFRSYATNLVGGALPQPLGYVRDPFAGTTQLATSLNPYFFSPGEISVSADGLFVAWEEIVDLNSFVIQVFRRDLRAGPAELISAYDPISLTGSFSDDGLDPAISGNGRYVAFATRIQNGSRQGIAVRDTCTGASAAEGCTPHTVPVSFDPSGVALDEIAYQTPPHISRDGRFVSFRGRRHNAGLQEYFLRDRDTDADGVYDEPGAAATIVATPDPDPMDPILDVVTTRYDLDASGRYLAFESPDPDLPDNGGSPPASGRVFLRDTCAGEPSSCTPSYLQLSVHLDTSLADGTTQHQLFDLSASARYVTIATPDGRMVGSDPNAFSGRFEAVLRDTCVNAPPDCVPGNLLVSKLNDGSPIAANVFGSRVNDDGTYVVFFAPRQALVSSPNPTFNEVLLARTGILPDLGGQPLVIARSPASAPAGSPELLLTVAGQRFVPGVGVLWNGALRPAIYISPKKLQLRLSPADLAAPGVATFRVSNPGGLTSGQVSFTVN